MSEPLAILYSFRRCPYAIRARMALAYAHLDVELREVILKNKPPHMLTASPAGTVPILILDKDNVLVESLDIIYWALSKNDPVNWLDGDRDSEEMSQQLLSINDGEFKYYLDRYKYFDRYPEKNQLFYRQSAEKFLKKLEKILTKNKFLLGDNISYVDVAIFPFIRQFAFVDSDWFFNSDKKHVIKWLKIFLTSDIFLLVMKKYKPWSSGDDKKIFP